jgi:hypothetical protein
MILSVFRERMARDRRAAWFTRGRFAFRKLVVLSSSIALTGLLPERIMTEL